MKIIIDIDSILYQKMKDKLANKTIKDALEDPLVTVCLHVRESEERQLTEYCNDPFHYVPSDDPTICSCGKRIKIGLP